MSRSRRKKRERERILAVCRPPSPPCPKCGKPGRHYAPPMFGAPGTWLCDSYAASEALQ